VPDNADAYQDLLLREVVPGIEAKQIPGYRGIEVLRRAQPDEVEFITVMTFDSIDSVIAFQGEDYERAYVPAAAQEVLERWDLAAQHYDLAHARPYASPD
jgi:antibiotic biosynthesis monooxygenase (ABM) superfamily enzyme